MTRRGDKKTKQAEQKRPQRRKRRASSGGAFLGLLMAAGMVFLWYGTELGWEELARKLFQPEQKEEEVWTPPSGGRVVEGEDFDYSPEWERDERWARAIKNGEAGCTLMKEAADRHYNSDEGDPFRFRAETTEASRMLELAVEDLAGLAKTFAKSDAARLEIGKLQRRYGEILEDRGPKAR